jgi:hypothetical protein
VFAEAGDAIGGADSAAGDVDMLADAGGAAAEGSGREVFSTLGTRCKVAPAGRDVGLVVVTDTLDVVTADGTNVIGGGVEEASALGATAGLSPCNSSFFSSSDAIKFRMKASVCFFSAADEIESLTWRCVWNSVDFSPNARLMHSRS